MDLTVLTYSLYLIISIAVTIWTANKLFKNGRVFLVDVYKGNTVLADSVNSLLVVGFYLINMGYIVYTLKMYETINNARELMEMLSLKTGLIILILGAMHFFNVFVFMNLRSNSRKQQFIKPNAE